MQGRGWQPLAPIYPSSIDEEEKNKITRMTRITSLDLGKRSNHAAIVSLTLSDLRPKYRIDHVQRWPLGTRYLKVAKDVADLPCEGTLVVDRGGVGEVEIEVLEVLAAKFDIVSILIQKSGSDVRQVGIEYHVPKDQLVSPLLVALEQREIAVAGGGDSGNLKKELLNFKKRYSATGVKFSGEEEQDDLAMALAQGLWYADKVLMSVGEIMAGGHMRCSSAPKGVFDDDPGAKVR